MVHKTLNLKYSRLSEIALES